MRRKFARVPTGTSTVVLMLLLISTLISLSSCLGATTQSSSFYDAGASNFTATGSQFSQYFLYRFNTSASALTFTLPDAADIVSSIPSPVDGEVLIFGVTADGDNAVNLAEGLNVTIKASAGTVQSNSTLTIYCVLDNVSSGSETVTVY